MIDKSLSQYQQDKKKVKKLKKSVKKLNKKAPKGEFLAYINPEEAELLKRHGGSGVMTKYGVPSFVDFGNWSDVASAASSGGASPSSSPSGNGSEPYTPTRSVKEEEWATGSYTPPSPEPSGEDQEEDVARMMIDMGLVKDPNPPDTSGEDQEEDVARMMIDMGLVKDPTTDSRESTVSEYITKKPQPKVLGVDKFGNPIIQRTTPYITPDIDTDTTPWYKPTTEKLIDTGKTKAKDWAKRQLISAGLKKAGLGFINPLLGISSLIAGLTKGKIDPVGYVTSKVTDKFSTVGKDPKFAKGPTKTRGPNKDREYGNNEETLATLVGSKGDVVSKAVNQFAGTKVETQLASLVKNDLNKALHYYAKMTPNIEAGKASQQEMDAYDLLGKYLVQAAPTKPDNRNYI